MKRKNIYIYSIFCILVVLFTIDTVTMALLGRHIYELVNPIQTEDQAPAEKSLTQCTNKAKIASLDSASDAGLKKLAAYQNLCNSFVADEVMIFTDMPKDDKVAKENAVNIAAVLKEYSKNGIKPLVIAEPVTAWGLVDFQEFKSGFYDGWIDTYFKELKNTGITDAEMGTWVPFPEANLPYWNHANAKPEDFGPIVNKYLSAMKKYFPNAEGSILLNSATYDNEDFDWRNGEYLSLVPYVSKVDKNLVSSFGLQGFPWAPQATDTGVSIINASEFLNHRLAIEAANALGVKKIWYNTATFRRKYTDDANNAIIISPEERLLVLNTVEEEAVITKNNGFEVSINLFSQDKSATKEVTDWSYLPEQGASNSRDGLVFTEFVNDLQKKGIHLSMFDR